MHYYYIYFSYSHNKSLPCEKNISSHVAKAENQCFKIKQDKVPETSSAPCPIKDTEYRQNNLLKKLSICGNRDRPSQ